jgi:hypothetical protein
MLAPQRPHRPSARRLKDFDRRAGLFARPKVRFEEKTDDANTIAAGGSWMGWDIDDNNTRDSDVVVLSEEWLSTTVAHAVVCGSAPWRRGLGDAFAIATRR